MNGTQGLTLGDAWDNSRQSSLNVTQPNPTTPPSISMYISTVTQPAPNPSRRMGQLPPVVVKYKTNKQTNKRLHPVESSLPYPALRVIEYE